MKHTARKSVVLGIGLALIVSAPSAFAANTLDVNAGAALVGNFGLEVILDGSTNQTFVADTTPAAETVYRAQFRIAHNNLTMAEDTGHGIFYGRMAGGVGNVIRIAMRRQNGEYKINCRVLRDTGGTDFCGKFTFAPNITRVGIEYVSATAPGANDGIFRLRKGDNIQFERSNLDTDTRVIDTVRLGVTKNPLPTTTGSFYLDDFSSFRTLAP